MPETSNSQNHPNNTPVVRVGRQAILDREQQVYGYELLYRGDCSVTCGDALTSSTLITSFMDIGLQRLTGGKKAFINLTRNFFTELPPMPFDKKAVVLEILEDIEVDDALISAVTQLRDQGYQLAIDDYEFEPRWDPLLPLVHIVKVEITEQIMPNIAEKMAPLRALPLRLLAEKVETQAQFRQLHALGFDLFQGYFFARPDLIEQATLAENQATVMQLLARINDPEADITQLAELISQDPALSFKLLRVINSAGVGLSREIDSIQQAVVLLGLQRIRAWATLFTLSGQSDKPVELLNLGLLRANLCERLARESGTLAADAAYTTGLLSILDGLLSQPMEQALQELPLPDAISQAIAEQAGDYGQLLQQSMLMEMGDFTPLPGQPDSDRLFALFTEASEAAFSTLNALD